jgi:hypothetical protein
VANIELVTRWYRNEDWLAVVLGAAVIVAVVAGVRPALPAFAWQNTAELRRILDPVQISRAILICIAYLLISAPGSVLAGASARKYAAGFPAVFALAWLAQIIAGNGTVCCWGWRSAMGPGCPDGSPTRSGLSITSRPDW